MNTQKHTPGLWELRQSIRGHFFIDYEQGGEGYTLTALECNEADARLICAAPELLIALQKIDSCAAESVEWIRRVAREAIAKATGEVNE